MKAGVLYYPLISNFLLVNMYYKDENKNLNCTQGTFDKNHAKPVSMYKKVYAALGIRPEDTKMNLFYFIFARNIVEYTKESNGESTFWKDVKLGIDLKWKDKIVFHVLMPPDTYLCTTYPTN